jgi:chemotaxis response regulator CheB
VAKHLRKPEVVSVMLTGMGADGAQGMKALSEKGVPVITQEKSSCVVYGMPKAVDDLGIADRHAKPPFVITESESYMLHPERL